MSQPSRVPRADVPSPPSPSVPPCRQAGQVWAGLCAPTALCPGTQRPDAELTAPQLFWWGPPQAAEFWGAQSPKAQAAGPNGTHTAPQSLVITDVLTKVRCKAIQKCPSPSALRSKHPPASQLWKSKSSGKPSRMLMDLRTSPAAHRFQCKGKLRHRQPLQSFLHCKAFRITASDTAGEGCRTQNHRLIE